MNARFETPQPDVIASVLDAIAPAKGLALVLYHLYCDESGTHGGSPVMTLAGYLFDHRQARMFGKTWNNDLAHFGLSAAHMTDCALGRGEYATLTMRQRIDSEKRLIKLVRKRTLTGYSVSADSRLYDEIMKDEPWAISAYSLLLLLLTKKISDFVRARIADADTKIFYFFEAGHDKQQEANSIMLAMRKSLKADSFYAGHAFVEKSDAPPLQAADMLAWQHRHFLIRRAAGHPMRKDFEALIRDDTDFASDLRPDHIKMFRHMVTRSRQIIRSGEPDWEERLALFFASLPPTLPGGHDA